MNRLSQNDPNPSDFKRSGPPVPLVIALVTVVLVIVVLHLTGVIGG